MGEGPSLGQRQCHGEREGQVLINQSQFASHYPQACSSPPSLNLIPFLALSPAEPYPYPYLFPGCVCVERYKRSVTPNHHGVRSLKNILKYPVPARELSFF